MPHHALTVPPPAVDVPLERQIAAVERALCIEDGRIKKQLEREQIHPTKAAIIRAELRAALHTLRRLAQPPAASSPETPHG